MKEINNLEDTNKLCTICGKGEGTVEVLVIDEITRKFNTVMWCDDCNNKKQKQEYDEHPTECEECHHKMGEISDPIKGDVNTFTCFESNTNVKLNDARLCEACLKRLNDVDSIVRENKY